MDIGAPELLLILILVLVLFGGKKLPELSRSIGESIRELRRGFTDNLKEDEGKTTSKDAKKS